MFREISQLLTHKLLNCEGTLPRQGDPAAAPIDLEHLDPQTIADLDDLGRVLDESNVELGDVHEAVLVDADVDECTEVRDIGDNPIQLDTAFPEVVFSV